MLLNLFSLINSTKICNASYVTQFLPVEINDTFDWGKRAQLNCFIIYITGPLIASNIETIIVCSYVFRTLLRSTTKMKRIHAHEIESIKTTSMENVRSTWEIRNIIQEVKIKPKNDMMYQGIYNCICQNTKKWRYVFHNVKLTTQLLFKNRFRKGGSTCRRQEVNPRHQMPHGQSVAKPETPLQTIQVE